MINDWKVLAAEKLAQAQKQLTQRCELCESGLMMTEELPVAMREAIAAFEDVPKGEVLWRLKDKLQKETGWVLQTATGYVDRSDCDQLKKWLKLVSVSVEALGQSGPVAPTTLIEAPFEALRTVHKFMKGARSSILIADNFLKDDIFDLLHTDSLAASVNIRLLTKRPSKSFRPFLKAFEAERGNIEVRKSDEIHDRYVVLDARSVLHCGASIEGIGQKLSSIRMIENPEEAKKVCEALEAAWRAANVYRSGEAT